MGKTRNASAQAALKSRACSTAWRVNGPPSPATIGSVPFNSSATISTTRTFSRCVRCGPSPVSALIASATRALIGYPSDVAP